MVYEINPEVQAREFDPAVDTLVAERDMKHGEGVIAAGEVIPLGDFPDSKLRQFIRVRFATVVPGARTVKVAEVPVAATPAAPEAPPAQVEGLLYCDFPGCKKPGPYKSKVNLGAHKRSHKE